MKRCGKCKAWKLLDSFTRNRSNDHGFSTYCKACKSAVDKEYREKNKERLALSKRKYYEKNKKKRSEYRRKHYLANKKTYIAYSAKQRADILQRTPEWADLEDIKGIYENCPEGHHVDHILPLRGDTVSGLHVTENLQYLTAEENLFKGNTYGG